jgi:ornithine carbamoyltransferase
VEQKIISLNEMSGEEIRNLIALAIDIKKNPDKYKSSLGGKNLLLLFQKTSTRTRAAFELGMKRLGGSTVVMDWDKSNFAISPVKYESRYLATVFDCILARLIKNTDIVELAGSVDIPVINGCCNLYHPSQILADVMTIYEIKGRFESSICFIGVQNNVANSLLFACKKLGIKLIFVTPLRDEIPEDVKLCMDGMENLEETLDLEHGAASSEFLYTDTWINMELFNDENYSSERDRRIEIMLPYQINKNLLKGRDVYIMHDMPVHPGYEIDEYAVDCDRSVIFRQAENRLYTAQALLFSLLVKAQQ